MKYLTNILSNFKEHAQILNLLAIIIATLAILRPQKNLISFIGIENDTVNIKQFVCREGVKSILLKSPNTHMVHTNLLEVLNQSNFEGVGEYKEVVAHAHVDARGLCRLVLTSPETRSFSVYLTESDEAPFSFLVTDINETPIKEN